jgi:Protein of unknown function (DUF1264)
VKNLVLVSLMASYFCMSQTVLAADSDSSSCGTGQKLHPIKEVGMYLDGFHTYKDEAHLPGDKQKQIRTAHYCKQVNPDMFQCLLYDGNGPNARVIGIEYVVTDKLFKTLPASEQALWHPHDSEVESELLVLPGLAEDKQKEILSTLKTTHGKTWQVWPNLADQVPLGKPVLMWNVEPGKVSSKTKSAVASRKLDPNF